MDFGNTRGVHDCVDPAFTDVIYVKLLCLSNSHRIMTVECVVHFP